MYHVILMWIWVGITSVSSLQGQVKDSVEHFDQNRLWVKEEEATNLRNSPERLKPHKETHVHQIELSSSVKWRTDMGKENLKYSVESLMGDSVSVKENLQPGSPAAPFHLPTFHGEITYPGPVLNASTPILFFSYHPHSAFLGCVWNCSGSIEDLVVHSPRRTHYVFMSHSDDAYSDAQWMRGRMENVVQRLVNNGSITELEAAAFLGRVHYVTVGVYQLGNWLTQVLHQWLCFEQGRQCGLNQVHIQSTDILRKQKRPLILPRLDARYDWLPYPDRTFHNKSLPLVWANDRQGCKPVTMVNSSVAMVIDGGCSYFQKVQSMQSSGALAVVVVQQKGSVHSCLQDMNCAGPDCDIQLKIPATMIPYNLLLEGASQMSLTFQSTTTESFFLGIDAEGRIAEVGRFLYPSMYFLSWQAQWFEYKRQLHARLSEQAYVIPVLNHTVMHGGKGAVAKVILPPLQALQRFTRFELDMSLGCPGPTDASCAAWDQTIQLYVCCRTNSSLCGMELGRWISSFHRRIGRWLTDVSPLLPLLDSRVCTFTMKTVPWAQLWLPSLNLRFSQWRATPEHDASLYPDQIQPLYQPLFTFDQEYNSRFTPTTFTVPPGVTKVVIVAVITGHGSDENGCGEFCVTSHHFIINGNSNNRTFADAGSPLGCATKAASGSEPNEYGTWLYGRDGWCDGQQVSPWVMDVTRQVALSGPAPNRLTYYGWFNGTDPHPKRNPGVMIFSSYLVYYKPFSVLGES